MEPTTTTPGAESEENAYINSPQKYDDYDEVIMESDQIQKKVNLEIQVDKELSDGPNPLTFSQNFVEAPPVKNFNFQEQPEFLRQKNLNLFYEPSDQMRLQSGGTSDLRQMVHNSGSDFNIMSMTPSPINQGMAQDYQRQLYNQLHINLLETIKFVEQEYFMSWEDAFEHIFFKNIISKDIKNEEQSEESDEEQESLALQICQMFPNKFHIKDFLDIYTEHLLEYNQGYQEALFTFQQLQKDQHQLIYGGPPEFLNYIDEHQCEDQNILEISLVYAQLYQNIYEPESSQKSPMLRVYIYIDDIFQYKTEIVGQNFRPVLDLKIKINLPEYSNHVRLDMYDASNLTDSQINRIQNVNMSEYGSPRPTNKQQDSIRSRVLSVSKLSDELNEPQEKTVTEIEEPSDDDEDCKVMTYIGTSIVTIDKILKKLMFGEKSRIEFESNQKIIFDNKKMEPQLQGGQNKSLTQSFASNDPKIRGKISVKFKAFLQSQHYMQRVEKLIDRKKIKITQKLQEVSIQVDQYQKTIKEASDNILYTDFVPNYGLEIQQKPISNTDDRSNITSFYPNQLRNSAGSSEFKQYEETQGPSHHFYNTHHFEDLRFKKMSDQAQLMGNHLKYVSVIEQEEEVQSELDSSNPKKRDLMRNQPSARKSIKKEMQIIKEKMDKDQNNLRLCSGCCNTDKCAIF